jgi:hypothetical protein
MCQQDKTGLPESQTPIRQSLTAMKPDKSPKLRVG